MRSSALHAKTSRGIALLAVLALLGATFLPSAASATEWSEWKRLMRERPVAVLVVIPPLILTSPFMGVSWLLSRGEEDGGGDDDE